MIRFFAPFPKGWPSGHPFLLLLLVSCGTAPAPEPASVAKPQTPCASTPAPEEQRFAFTQVASGLPRAGQWRDKFDVADMNGDGWLDIVHGPARKGSGTLFIFLGDGAGRFTPWRTARFPQLPYDYGDAKAADFDGNGLMDLALSSHLRGLTVLVQEVEGHFSPWASGLELRVPAGGVDPPFTSRAIAVVDWNRDRAPDILALNEGPTQFGPRPPNDALMLFVNRQGEWQHVAAPSPQKYFGTSIATGDVNGDGHPDAITGTNVGGVRALLQLGDGKSWTSRELRALPETASVTSVALQQRTIFAATAWYDGASACTGVERIDAMQDTATALVKGASNDPYVAIVPADLDGDGRGDLLALRTHGSMAVFRGAAEGLVRDADVPTPRSMAGCDAYDAHAADLDGDGAAEVIVSFAGDLSPTLGEPCTHGGGFVVWRVNSRP